MLTGAKRRARLTKWSFIVMIWFTVSELNWNTILSGVGQVLLHTWSFIVARVCLLTLTPKLIRIIFRIQTLSWAPRFQTLPIAACYNPPPLPSSFSPPLHLPSRVTTHSLYYIQTKKRDSWMNEWIHSSKSYDLFMSNDLDFCYAQGQKMNWIFLFLLNLSFSCSSF